MANKNNMESAIESTFNELKTKLEQNTIVHSGVHFIAMAMGIVEQFQVPGSDKSKIVLSVIDKLQKENTIQLPDNVMSEINVLLQSNMMHSVMNVICAASKKLYDINPQISQGCSVLNSFFKACVPLFQNK